MTAPVALSIVCASIVLGITSAVAIVRLNRRRAYQRWPGPARWLWYILCAVLIALGAAVLVNDYVNDWGWAAAIWLLVAPFVFGVRDSLTGRPSSPEPR